MPDSEDYIGPGGNIAQRFQRWMLRLKYIQCRSEHKSITRPCDSCSALVDKEIKTFYHKRKDAKIGRRFR